MRRPIYTAAHQHAVAEARDYVAAQGHGPTRRHLVLRVRLNRGVAEADAARAVGDLIAAGDLAVVRGADDVARVVPAGPVPTASPRLPAETFRLGSMLVTAPADDGALELSAEHFEACDDR